MPRRLMVLSPLRLRHQLHAAIKLESHDRRNGDTISETSGGRTMQCGK